MDLKNICEQLIKLSEKTAAFINQEKGKIQDQNIEVKSLNSFVTYVDKSSEKLIVDGLREILPEAGFIAEEGTSTEKGERYNWIIDPLDGTTNFIHNITPYAISIALADGDDIIVGLIHEIGLNEVFYAWKDGGAYLNGKQIKVTETSDLGGTLIATGFPYYDYERMDAFLLTMKEFMLKTRGVRRLGSAATDLAYVACGRFDAFYEYSLSPWDVAAGAIIVQEAGGVVTDFSGKNNYIYGKEIIASNENVNKDFTEVIKKHMQ